MRQLTVMGVIVLFLAGCGGSKEIEKSKPISPTAELERYESEFRPSDYDMDVKIFLSELRRERERKSIPTDPSIAEPLVSVPGFRVQLLSTTEIDSANAWKTEAEAAFEGEWFYIVYDAPTYKLRAGNFVNRNDASTYAQLLADAGYPDAWVVPERVFKSILPRPVTQPPTEELIPKK